MHQLKSDLSNTGIIFSVSTLSLQLVIFPYKTQTEICTLGNEKMELREMAEKTHNPIKICIATNSTILTIASKWKDTVPAFKFYRIAVVHILYQNCGFNSSFEGVLFWFRKYLEGTLQFPLKLQKNLSVKGTIYFALGLIFSGDG